MPSPRDAAASRESTTTTSTSAASSHPSSSSPAPASSSLASSSTCSPTHPTSFSAHGSLSDALPLTASANSSSTTLSANAGAIAGSESRGSPPNTSSILPHLATARASSSNARHSHVSHRSSRLSKVAGVVEEEKSGTLNLNGVAAESDVLEQMGYKQELHRGLTSFMSFAYSYAYVSALLGVSFGFDATLQVGGPAEMVWTWIICSVFSVINGLCMAEIASVYPTAGSVYHWAGLLSPSGRWWGPLAAYFCGWFNILGSVAGTASYAVGFATYVNHSLNINNPDLLLTTNQQVGVGIAVLTAWFAMNMSRSDQLGWLNTGTVLYQMFITVIISVCLLSLTSEHASAYTVFATGYDTTGVQYSNSNDDALAGATTPILNSSGNVTIGSADTSSGSCCYKVSAYTIVLGMANALFSFTGYESAAHMAEETHNARTSAPRSILTTVLAASVFGLTYILGLLFSSPDPAGWESPLQDIFKFAAGDVGGEALLVLLVICYFLVGAPAMAVTSRSMFAMVRDRGLPFSGFLYYVGDRNKVPVRCVMLVYTLCVLILLLPLVNTAAQNAVVGTCTIGLQISYAIPIGLRCLMHISKQRRAEWVEGRWSLGKFSFPLSLISSTWLVLSSCILFWPFAFPVNKDNMNWTVVVIFGMLAIATAHWLLSARHHFVGPRRLTQPHVFLSAKEIGDLQEIAERASSGEAVNETMLYVLRRSMVMEPSSPALAGEQLAGFGEMIEVPEDAHAAALKEGLNQVHLTGRPESSQDSAPGVVNDATSPKNGIGAHTDFQGTSSSSKGNINGQGILSSETYV